MGLDATSLRAQTTTPTGGRSRTRVLLPLPLTGAYDYAVPEAALFAPAPMIAYRLGEPAGIKLTPARRRVLAAVETGQAFVPRDLAAEAGVSPAVLRGLLEAGALEAVALPEARAGTPPDWRHPG